MPRSSWVVIVALAAVVVAALVVPWGDLGPRDDADRERSPQVVVRDSDNPAPRTREAEQLERARRGEREFLRDVKDAARAERVDRIREQRRAEAGAD